MTAKRTRKAGTLKPLPVASAELQVAFYSRLQSLKGRCLSDALSAALRDADITKIDQELAHLVGQDYLRRVARFGLRGEVLFPVPLLIISDPNLLGYYRLLYGLSQKEFYKGPLAVFRRLEEAGGISPQIESQVPALCASLVATGKSLLDGIDKFSSEIAHDLQLLTLGPQLRGSRNTTLGQVAAKVIFDLIKTVLGRYIVSTDSTSMTVKNASGRRVMIAFASDPDIQITEQLSTTGLRPIVSIEIKGGTDYSNIHNRIGEAEKSHQKARKRGFFEFWTIIGVALDYQRAKLESPTTSHFFQLAKITDPNDLERARFRELLGSLIGVRTSRRSRS